MNQEEREKTKKFRPNLDKGFVAAMIVNQEDNEPLMLAYMNEEAINKTLETGVAHFYSRSRKKIWMKGETSGNKLLVEEIRVDCDQDALWIKVKPTGPACHTGKKSCFFRKLNNNDELVEVDSAI